MTTYIFILIIALFLFAINRYILVNFREKINNLNIIDKNFSKPQAFHSNPTPRIGGLFIFFNIILFSSILFFYQKQIELSFVLCLVPFFIIGFLDDVKILENPKFRIIFLIIAILTIIFVLNINIERTGVEFLDNILKQFVFLKYLFILFCFLTIINGCNFIDGFNGLLIIHSIIIILILLILNFNNIYFNNLLILLVSIVIVLFLNFPKAKVFLGDSGAYLIGFILSVYTIKTSNYDLNISPFFFCTLLFYLFFEVLFSFARKKVMKQNPLFPDKNHMHMILFRIINKKKYKDKIKANYMTSIYINFSYILMMAPIFFFRYDNSFCKIYFIICLLLYTIIYFFLKKYENYRK